MGLSDLAKRLLGKTGINLEYFLPSGEQYCPYCHTKTAHRAAGYFECEICFYSITDEEAENCEGYPTLESTYEEEIYHYDSDTGELIVPWECKSCGGPYPDCASSCDMFDDEDYCDYECDDDEDD